MGLRDQALEQKKKAAEEEQRRQAEAAAERAAEEERRRDALRQRLAEQAAEQARKAEEELRLEAERAMELERQQAEERAKQEAESQRLAQELQRMAEEEAEAAQQARLLADRTKLDAFLKAHGYTGVNVKRTSMWFKSKCPLHSAVKANDAEIVRLLLNFGAVFSVKNSAGQTPMQLAQKLNRKGSHAAVIAVLSERSQ